MLPEKRAIDLPGAELKDFLSRVGMDQQTFAHAVGMHPVSISNWVAGKKVPTRPYQLAARYIMQIHAVPVAKRQAGRSLAEYGFDMAKARCEFPGCQRGNRQMWGDKKAVYEHVVLGLIRPVFCNGTPAHRHPRVTRALDRHGNLHDISQWPRRRSLAPYEDEKLKNVRIQSTATANDFLGCLQRCTPALDRAPGCGEFLSYNGREMSTDSERQKLYRFKCLNSDCKLQWIGRLFDRTGNEVERKKIGQGHRGERRQSVRVPPNARRCPVRECDAELRFPREVTEIGGNRYQPALIRLVCVNEKNIDHREKRRHMAGVPEGTRKGLIFYYNPKRSRWEDVLLKPLKSGSPIVRCRLHGRMCCNKFTTTRSHRIPKDMFEKLGSEYPIFRTYCLRCGLQVWFSADQKKRIVRRPKKRTRAAP